ncbi:kyphoscoliosis peptidase-like [Polyodon spathula]|uniref:kyphoscoliosis peptidase-like n=1 Tax=Polyodon spathula TaxID=7913 RepID=UPI001B7E005B|nr:kyphoscoliosis peptidase-like [Polyodon spathula]
MPAFPWDQSSLKSLQVDLTKFNQLDAFATQVSTQSSVEVLVKELLQKAQTDVEKLRAIWMWVTHHIEYNTEAFHDEGLRTGASEDVLRTGKAVCPGYTGLFKEMCYFAGIDCVEVSGYSKGFSYVPGKPFSRDPDHSWNAVSLGGSWHLLDSTWGAGNVNSNCSQFTFQYNEFYFLTHPALFIGNHFPVEEKWQLLNSRVSLSQFENALLKKSYFYSIGLLSIKPNVSLIKTVNGKVTITVKSQSPTLFTHTLNKKKECGIITLTADGMSLDIYPKTIGIHQLKIYTNQFDSTETYDCVCEYQLQCESVNKELKLPSAMRNPVGPSWLTEIKGLLQPSQCSPIVYTQDGHCAFRFLLEKDLSFILKLSLENVNASDDLSRHVFIYREGNWMEFKIQIPRAGINPSVQWPVFPLVYPSWQQEYELVEPLSGVLPAQRILQFKVRIPGVAKVLVESRDTQELSVSSDGYWTGSCSTAGCMDLTVMVLHKPTDSSYSLLGVLITEAGTSSSGGDGGAAGVVQRVEVEEPWRPEPQPQRKRAEEPETSVAAAELGDAVPVDADKDGLKDWRKDWPQPAVLVSEDPVLDKDGWEDGLSDTSQPSDITASQRGKLYSLNEISNFLERTKDMDASTAFFFGLERKTAQNNVLSEAAGGREVSSPAELRRVAVSFYTDLYKAEGCDPGEIELLLQGLPSLDKEDKQRIGQVLQGCRGIRQGCSLSGMLYALSVEPLLYQLRGKLPGLAVPAVPNATPMKLSAYFDDLSVFVTTDRDIAVAWFLLPSTLPE